MNSSIADKLVGTAVLHYDGKEICDVTDVSSSLKQILGTDENSGSMLEWLGHSFDLGILAETIESRLIYSNSYTTVNIIDKKGELLDVQLHLKVANRSGKTITVELAIFDVTETVKHMTRHGNKLEAIAALSADFIFEYVIGEDLAYITEKSGNEFTVTHQILDFESEFKNKKIISDDDIEAFERLCDELRLGKENINAELRFYNDNTCDYAWYIINGRTICNENGEPEYVVGRVKNISRNKDNEMALIQKAERDPLTQIYNKATTKTLIKDYLRTDSREIFDALIIVDVDNFKQVNDNLGHLFGDSVLVDLSQEMQDLFRSSDVVGRIGGDEFLVFIRGIKHRTHIAEKAADICKIFDLLYSGENEEKITGSLGISIFPQDGTTYDELFKKADIALYSSKNAGKNCYTFYSDIDAPMDLEDGQSYVNKYRKDASLSPGREVFDSQITDFAFDIMNKTKNVSSAISMLLSKVGKHFNLSRVSVVETTEEPYSFKYTYQWCAKSVVSRLEQTIVLGEDRWKQLIDDYDDNDIIMLTEFENTASYPDILMDDVSSNPIRSLLNCAIYDSGEYKGFVSLTDCTRNRVWTIDEVRALKNITKIISSYLLKMRAFQKANRMVDQLTNYDNLTGLPRFNKFKQTVTEIVEGSHEKFALIHCDVNNFKYINEKYGSEIGDKILCTIAEQLTAINSPQQVTSRVFSDKFITLIMCSDRSAVDIMRSSLDNISALSKAIIPDCNLSIACGIYNIENNNDFDINIAVDNVNIARKLAKENTETSCVVYESRMKNKINRTIELVNEARLALVNREFVVYYQPKIVLKDGSLVGAEALVRWKKPDGSIVPPGEFIPCLEKNGMIVNIDFYVYEEVCRFIRRHLDENKPIVPISVNVSRVHLRDPNFLTKVYQLTNKYNIPSSLLEFELTESVFLENQSAAVNTMSDMKKYGFMVSIDDFGSGFSSLGLLKSLPVDILKIDREFFANEPLQQNDQIVISSIISMASRMNISVICEGVETIDQVEFLKQSKCDMVQGYYYARPICEEEFEKYTEEHIRKV